jgi:hypothetical protein
MSQAVHGRDLVLSDRCQVQSAFGTLTCRQSAFGQLGCPAIGHAWRAPTDRQGHQPNAVQPNAVQAHQS